MALVCPVPPPLRLPKLTAAEQQDKRLIEAWLANKASTTARNYLNPVSRLRDYAKKPLSKLTRVDIEGFFEADQDSARVISDAPRNIAIRSLLLFLHMEHIHPINLSLFVPANDFHSPENDIFARLPPNDVVTLLGSAGEDARLLTMLVLMSHVGLSSTEIVALDASNFMAKNSRLFVPGAHERYLDLPKPIATILRTYRIEIGMQGPLFPNRSIHGEKRLSARQVLRIVTAAGRAVDLDVSPSKLRNSFIHECLVQRCTDDYLKKQFGLTSLKVVNTWRAHFRRTVNQIEQKNNGRGTA